MFTLWEAAWRNALLRTWVDQHKEAVYLSVYFWRCFWLKLPPQNYTAQSCEGSTLGSHTAHRFHCSCTAKLHSPTRRTPHTALHSAFWKSFTGARKWVQVWRQQQKRKLSLFGKNAATQRTAKLRILQKLCWFCARRKPAGCDLCPFPHWIHGSSDEGKSVLSLEVGLKPAGDKISHISEFHVKQESFFLFGIWIPLELASALANFFWEISLWSLRSSIQSRGIIQNFVEPSKTSSNRTKHRIVPQFPAKSWTWILKHKKGRKDLCAEKGTHLGTKVRCTLNSRPSSRWTSSRNLPHSW